MKKLIIITVTIVFMTVSAFADGEYIAADAEASPPYSYVLMEGSTGTLLYADNGNAPFIPFHSSKLMTLLLVMESMDRGELSFDTVVTVSRHANSQQGSQIWLDVGEKIKIDELVSAVTVGNANDACAALAEAVAGTEESFVSLMNQRAKELGMSQTVYADSTGTGAGSVTTASDTAILASELSRYDCLTEYFTTWMTTVRGGKAELASTNRLIKSYGGITGMKAYYHEDCGNCLVATAKRNGITMVCVIMGEPDEFERFNTAKEKMNIGFSAYSIYQPKRRDIITEPVSVKGGEKTSVETETADLGRFVIRTGTQDDIEISLEYYDDIEAPVYAGDAVGRAVYSLNGNELYSVKLVAKSDVKKINIFSAFLRLARLSLSG